MDVCLFVCACVLFVTYRCPNPGPNGLQFGMGVGMDRGTVCGWVCPSPSGGYGRGEKAKKKAILKLKNDRRL